MHGLAQEIRMAVRSASRNRTRTAVLGAGLALVAAVLVLASALARGVEQALTETGRTILTGDVNVNGFLRLRGGGTFGVLGDYEDVVRIVREAVPEASTVVHRGRGWAVASSDAGTLRAFVIGVDLERERDLAAHLAVASGRLSDLATPGALVLLERQARRLGVGVGDVVTLASETGRGVTNTIDLRVAAVARDAGLLGDFALFVPIASFRRLYQLAPTATGSIQLRFPGGARRAPETAERLRSALRAAGYRVRAPDARPSWAKLAAIDRERLEGQVLDVSTWEDELSFLSWAAVAFRLVVAALGIVLLATAAAGVANATWAAIRERVRELGTLRALGMSAGGICRIVVLEAGFLAAGAAIVGAVVAVAIAYAMSALAPGLPGALRWALASDRLRLPVEPGIVVATIAAVAATSMLAAIVPAMRAARLSPRAAMARPE